MCTRGASVAENGFTRRYSWVLGDPQMLLQRHQDGEDTHETEQAPSLLALWCREMARDPMGRLILTNLYHDFVEARLPRELIRCFLDEVLVEWSRLKAVQMPRSGGDGPLAVLAFGSVRDRVLNSEIARWRSTPPLPLGEQCSAVVHVKEIEDVVDWDRAPEVGITYPLDEAMLAFIEAERIDLSRIAKEHAEWPPKRKMAWVTKTDYLAGIRREMESADSGALASRVKSVLGLHHYLMEQTMLRSSDDPYRPAYMFRLMYVEVQYPRDLFGAEPPNPPVRLHPPTFVDGGPSYVYRSKKSTRDPDWGLTVDLEDSSRDGAPEAVHLRVPVKEGFALRTIGRPQAEQTNLRGPVADNAAVYPWDDKYIAELEQLCTRTSAP